MRATLLPAAGLAATALIPWTGELTAATYLVGLAFVAPTCGWWLGRHEPGARALMPSLRVLGFAFSCGLPLFLLARPQSLSIGSALIAVAALVAAGSSLRALCRPRGSAPRAPDARRDASPGAGPALCWGAVWTLVLSGLAIGLPLGFGVPDLVWARDAPGLASRLLDLSPWTLVMESAGFDWMRDPRVYDPAGTEWFSDTRRPYPVLTGLGSAWSAAGLKSLAAPGLVVVGCATSFIAGRLRPVGSEC